MIQLTINNKKISVEAGTTILEAAKQNGINIP
jgi:NADH dehydrogenase/NADH:ubiquinone oxidoreductase subunit G